MEYRTWLGKKFYFVGPKITTERVERFCVSQGLWLPLSYKQFLLEVNGGRPVEDVFVIPGLESSLVGGLGGIDRRDAASDLEILIRDYPIPKQRGFIDIGYDASGSDIFMKVVGATRGSLWFADRYGDEELGNLWFIARSFTEFISKLHAD